MLPRFSACHFSINMYYRSSHTCPSRNNSPIVTGLVAPVSITPPEIFYPASSPAAIFFDESDKLKSSDLKADPFLGGDQKAGEEVQQCGQQLDLRKIRDANLIHAGDMKKKERGGGAVKVSKLTESHSQASSSTPRDAPHCQAERTDKSPTRGPPPPRPAPGRRPARGDLPLTYDTSKTQICFMI